MNIARLFAPVEGMGLAEAASHYAREGLPVFPCAPGGKRPLLAHGFHEASTNAGQVHAWWRRWPRANIGIPTGPSSGLEVVDVDVKGAEPRGPKSWRRATEAGLLTDWVVHVVTPSGGLHAYYPASETEQRSWALGAAQLDFRGAGGYIIAPPSVAVIAGVSKTYRLFELSTGLGSPVDAVRLREFLDPRPVRSFEPGRRFEGTLRERTERLASWLHTQGEGERNQGLFWASCRLAENGVALPDALQALGPVAEDIGLPPREIERTIQSAFRTTQSIPAARSATALTSTSRSSRREARAVDEGRVIA